MRRMVGLGMVVLACNGCFRWAPITSLADLDDDLVHVTNGTSMITLEHASARGRYVEGRPIEGAGEVTALDDCARPACAAIEVSHAHVTAKRLNVGATATIVILAVVGVAASVFLAAVVAFTASRPIPEGF